jgi:hypothetical protein
MGLMKLFRRKSPAETREHHFGGTGGVVRLPLPITYKFRLDLEVSVSYRPKPEVHDRPLSGGSIE